MTTKKRVLSAAVQEAMQAHRQKNGQFGRQTFKTSGISLLGEGSTVETLRSRLEAIENGGYAPPIVVPTQLDVQNTRGIDEWHDSVVLAGQHMDTRNEARSVPKMPDDATNTDHGRGSTGRRRLPRMKYEGEDLSLRMNSVSAIRRFAKEQGTGQFDIPVQSTRSDGSSELTWLRVQATSQGDFFVKGPGDNRSAHTQMVADAVGALLEGRSPQFALSKAELRRRNQERQVRIGAEIRKTRPSPAVRGFGAIPASGMVMTEIRRSDSDHADYYIHRAPQLAADIANPKSEIVNTEVPTATFNRQIRGHKPLGRGCRCDRCGNVYPEALQHLCPKDQTGKNNQKADTYRDAVRAVRAITKGRTLLQRLEWLTGPRP